MVKLYPALIKGISIVSLHMAAKSPNMSISWTPFGDAEFGTAYTKAPPKLKGQKGMSQPSHLRAFSNAAKGEYGVVTVNVPNKGFRKMPSAAAKLLRMGKHGKAVARAGTVSI